MDACVKEAPLNARPITPTRTSATSLIGYLVIATVSVGIAWRIVRFAAGFPIWGDEAMLLLNVLERDYLGLTEHLRFAQVAPLFFLWLEKTALLAFGSSEWSVHLFPFLAGLAALGLFWQLCRTSFSPTIAGLAVAILAVSYYPVRHGAEVKPYSFDLLCSVAFAWLALGHFRNLQSTRWLVGLVIAAPIAVFSSYPSVFVGGAVSLVLLPRMIGATWLQRSLWIAFNVALCGSFVVHYLFVGKEGLDAAEAERIREFLHNYWKDAFPPESLLDWPLWLVQVLTGNMLAYPAGANRGGSAITFVLLLVGVIAIWRSGSRPLFALCLLPFALNLVAACIHKYPFGGSARITLHLAPFICILMAHGMAQSLDWIRSAVWRDRIHFAFVAFLFICGIVGVARDLIWPYKTIHDRDVRGLVLDLRTKIGAEPVFLCHARQERLIAEFSWYMRTQTWQLDFLPDNRIEAGTSSVWLVYCRNDEPSVDDVMAHLGTHATDWSVVESEVGYVQPENKQMPPLYCRWVHIARR